MPRKNHRPFAGLTGPQLCVISDVAQERHVYRQQRAVTGLINKGTPPITHGRRGYKLTPAGEALWAAMKEWRPDLYAK